MKPKTFAHRLVPWKRQVSRIITILVVCVVVGAVAMVYLSFSEQMTDKKLRIQVLQQERSNYTRQIAALTTEEGKYTAYRMMQRRAEMAGYVNINFYDEDSYEYVIVDGYTGTGINSVPPEVQPEVYEDTFIRPEYTQSLQQWLTERIAVGIQSYESDN